MSNDPYVNYYLNQQQGNGMAVFHGSPWQRGYGQMGYGLGGIFRAVARGFVPLAKNVGKMLGKIALHTGANVLGDVASGRNLKEAIKSRGKEGLRNARSEALKRIQTGRGRKRTKKKSASRNKKTAKTIKKRKASTSTIRNSQTKKRRTAQDIFG